jgi:hypothetical protein
LKQLGRISGDTAIGKGRPGAEDYHHHIRPGLQRLAKVLNEYVEHQFLNLRIRLSRWITAIRH